MTRSTGILLACVLVTAPAVTRAQPSVTTPTLVEPSDLARRVDLVGQEVLVDDRVAFYVTRGGNDDDELQLKRTPVTFLVPRRLRPAQTRMVSAVIRGRLERQSKQLVCRVEAIELKPPDLQRLEGALAQLRPGDYRTRRAWARWAEHRATAFHDEPLARRARALEAEALKIEGEMKRVTVDAPEQWLRMAHEARDRKVAEPEPSALAHRALRARLASADGLAALRMVASEVDAFFPGAGRDRESAKVSLKRWEAQYADDPASAYREASDAIRKAMDRRLWADVRARIFEAEPVADLPTAIALADRAAEQLPERFDLPAKLVEQGIVAARRDLGTLRQDEVRRLADVYRDRLRRPEEARQVLRDWLDRKRSKLSDSDAEGRVALAPLYEEMAGDRVTAVELLRKAWEIDPNSRETAEAFRLRGYRREKDKWVEAAAQAPSAPVEPVRATAASASLIGLTADELKRRLIAEPTSRSYVASRGRLIEQRVYLDTGSVRYVNLLRTPGESQPRVIADYTLPRNARKEVPHQVP